MMQNLFRRHWRYWLSGILALLAVTGIVIELRNAPAELGTEKLTVALPQYRTQLQQRLDFMHRVRAGSSSEIERARRYAALLDRQMAVLHFKLEITPDNNVLGVALDTMRIMDLKNQLDEYVALLRKLADYYAVSRSEGRSIDALFNELETMPLSEADRAAVEACRRDIAAVEAEAAAGVAVLSPFLTMSGEFEKRLSVLDDYGEKRRSDSFEKYFFKSGENFTELIRYGGVALHFWGQRLGATLRSLLPTGGVIWLYLIGLLLLIEIPLLLAGRWMIYPMLRQHIPHDEGYSASRVLPCGFALLGAGVALMLAERLVGAGPGMLFDQCGVFLAYLGCLLPALAFRVPRRNLINCLRLYLPQIVLTLVAKALYCLLIPYEPLVQLLPGICLAGVIWLVWELRKNHYPILDTVFGYVTLVIYLMAGYCAFFGLPFMGFTLLLLWFSRLVQFMTVLALTEIAIRSIQAHPERNHWNNVLRSLWIPGLWMSMVWNLVMNLSSTYHLSDWMDFLRAPLPLPKEICSFSAVDVWRMVIAFFITRFIIDFGKALVRNIYREQAEYGKIPSLLTLGSYSVWTVYVLLVLVTLQVNASSILVVLGGFSMGLGFAMREVLENFVAGIILLVGQHVRPGDIIEFDGIMGTVRSVNFRATVVDSWDGSVITLPNTRVIGKDFRNWTRNNQLMRRSVVVGVAYGSDLELVRRTLLEVAARVPEIRQYPLPRAFCSDFAASSVEFTVWIWVEAKVYPYIASQYREQVLAAFRELGIEIPFDQLDVKITGRVAAPSAVLPKS